MNGCGYSHGMTQFVLACPGDPLRALRLACVSVSFQLPAMLQEC